MKKYETPTVETVLIALPALLAGSFEEGEQGGSGTGEGTADPSQGL